MQIILALLLTIATAGAQYVGQFRGDYLGVAIPSARCSNERWTVNIIAEPNGDFYGEVGDFDAGVVNHFKGRLNATAKTWCLTGWDVTSPDWNPLDPLNGWTVKLSFNAKTGTIRGTMDGRPDGFCFYTFTAYRRFKVAQ